MIKLTLEQIRFSLEKSGQLRLRHGIGFEEIAEAMTAGAIIEIYPHPSAKFRHQRIAAVMVQDYAYLVPFVSNAEGVFLKTFYPSRKATKHYGVTNGKS